MSHLHLNTENNNRRLLWQAPFAPKAVQEKEPDAIDTHTFAVQDFSRYATIVVSKLIAYLADDSVRGLALKEPASLLKKVRELMADGNQQTTALKQTVLNEEKLADILDLYIKTGIPVYSPGYMGRQFSGVMPLTGLIDLVSSIISQPSSFYEAAQLPNVVEHVMADEFNQFIGWEPGTFEMVTTSGGALGNLTALLAARNSKFPHIWAQGIAGSQNKPCRPAIAVSENIHYSISRAAGIIGIGEDQMIRLPTNEKQQICVEKVSLILEEAERKGLQVFCIVASAGSTSIGAFDPIAELADIARERDLWLHIDAAHGGSLLFSDQLRGAVKGIEKADSFVWDAHKMLFMPAVCTLLFYKNKAASYQAFNQEASYVFEENPDIYTEFDSAEKNFECTKRPLIMNLWVSWTLYGRKLFADKIEYICTLTLAAYNILQEAPDFQALHRPEANILCFRYTPDNLAYISIGDFQLQIRNRIRKEGKFFISKVDIDKVTALRVVFTSQKIATHHFYSLLDEIRDVGQSLVTTAKSKYS